jgi:hypothetical protein
MRSISIAFVMIQSRSPLRLVTGFFVSIERYWATAPRRLTRVLDRGDTESERAKIRRFLERGRSVKELAANALLTNQPGCVWPSQANEAAVPSQRFVATRVIDCSRALHVRFGGEQDHRDAMEPHNREPGGRVRLRLLPSFPPVDWAEFPRSFAPPDSRLIWSHTIGCISTRSIAEANHIRYNNGDTGGD